MIDDLIQVVENRIFTTSLKVAESFGKRHDSILKSIDKLIEDIDLLQIEETPWFEKSCYRNDQNGESCLMYLMDRDGFALLTMRFTGKEVLERKLKYIQAFNEMERRLRANGSDPQDKRLDIVKLLSETSQASIEAIKGLYPEYFTLNTTTSNLERISDLNTTYQKWLEDYGITRDWIENFPTSDIYNNYMRFCIENRFIGMDKKVFYAILESDFVLSETKRPDGHCYFVSA